MVGAATIREGNCSECVDGHTRTVQGGAEHLQSSSPQPQGLYTVRTHMPSSLIVRSRMISAESGNVEVNISSGHISVQKTPSYYCVSVVACVRSSEADTAVWISVYPVPPTSLRVLRWYIVECTYPLRHRFRRTPSFPSAHPITIHAATLRTPCTFTMIWSVSVC